MAAIKMVCKQHGLHVGGCDCLGAMVRTVDCPFPELHESQGKMSMMDTIKHLFRTVK